VKQVPITIAQMIAEELHARGVVVLAFTPVAFSSVSYGATRRECRQMRQFLDRIVRMLADGSLEPWGEPQGQVISLESSTNVQEEGNA